MRSIFALPLLLASLTVASCSAATMTTETGEPAAATEPTTEPADAPAIADAPAASPSTTDTATSAATETIMLAAVYAEDGVAIAGADPVAYFTEGAYVPGSAEFVYEWSGTTWQFASAANRDEFASNPTQYAPQYGGFCAWAISQGYTAPVDPTAWKIVDGKLYLNYDQNIQARWERDIPGNIAQADRNWPQVVEQ